MVWAHPRSRGENSASALAFSRPHGSSPLTRGKLPRELVDVLSEGLIPAHAGKTPPRASACRRSRAHPRSRGENWNAMRKRSKGAGSSPLTRGKRSVTVPVNITARLIPAHAGKTLFPPFRSATRAAHPRSRGENVQVTGAALDPKGSSPLTRGKRRPGGAPLRPCRLIPAHAGKTRCWSACHFPFGAHPRSRGENLDMAWSKSAADGSSPLTRGKLLHGALDVQRARLIPAHAGKTLGEVLERYVAGAHPRSRGENRETGRIRVRSLGSSPLTRGKLPPRSARGRRRGLIPAHAGKTCFRRSVWRRGPAHPRSRGENLFSPFSLATRAGSSPLTRGKRPGCARSRMARRLIPAHAGKTKSTRLPASTPPAHPRSRGENEFTDGTRHQIDGSSPLTRGKPGLFSYTGHQCGLIPAHAGKTRHFAGGGACHAAHPRSRGENPVRCVDGQAASGSSPLTRGKHMPSRVTPKQQRLIPAHAGKTARQGPGSLSPRAHPRSRGENTTTAAHPASTGGSSPLTRGKPSSGRHPT